MNKTRYGKEIVLSMSPIIGHEIKLIQDWMINSFVSYFFKKLMILSKEARFANTMTNNRIVWKTLDSFHLLDRRLYRIHVSLT